MKKIYLLILILIVWNTNYGQNPIELSEPSQFTDWIGFIDGYNVCSLSPEKIIIAYSKGNSWDGRLKVGVIQNDNTIEYGEVSIFSQEGGLYIELAALSDNKFFLMYKENVNLFVRAGKVINGNQIILGNAIQIDPTQQIGDISITTLHGDTAIIAYHDSDQGVCRVLETDESLDITIGSDYYFTNTTFSNSESLSIDALSDSSFVVAYNHWFGNVKIGTINNSNQIAFSPFTEFNNDDSYNIDVVGLQENKFAIAFMDENNVYKGTLVIGTKNSNNQVTYSNKYVFNEESTFAISALKLNANEVVIGYTKSDPIIGLSGHLFSSHINDNDVQFSEPVIFNENGINGGVTPLTHLVDQKFIVQYADYDNFPGYVRIGEADHFLDTTTNEYHLDYAIYTNPHKNQLIVETLKTVLAFSLELFDINGRLIHKSEYKTKNYVSIDLNNFQSGVYIVRLKDEKNIITKRILIK